MNISGNTILITGGGSGIGRGLAEALHHAGNHVIIAGRRREILLQVVASNNGMKWITLDIENPASIRGVAAQVAIDYPALNVVIHNAGVMKPENLTSPIFKMDDAESMIAINLLGPMRLTTALMSQLTKQPRATIMTVSSGLAFMPLAMSPTYCATKAAVHSWTQSLRWQLRGTNIEVVELIPPYVQTELMGSHQASDPRAMPLNDFLAEVMQIIKTNPSATEICVERVKALRFAAETGNYDPTFNGLNESMPAPH